MHIDSLQIADDSCQRGSEMYAPAGVARPLRGLALKLGLRLLVSVRLDKDESPFAIDSVRAGNVPGGHISSMT